MEAWKIILISFICVMVVLTVAFSVFCVFKAREEKELPTGEYAQTHISKSLSVFLLVLVALSFCAGIVIIIYFGTAYDENVADTAIITASVVVTVLFSVLCLFCYAYARFNCVVAYDEGVLVCRLFKKKSYYSYEEIGSFKDLLNIPKGYLVCWDKDGKKIFVIGCDLLGAQGVALMLRAHGVQEKK